MYYLKKGQTEFPCIVDYDVVRKIMNQYGYTKLSTFKAEFDLDDLNVMEDLAFFALQRGHKIEGKEFTLTKEDVTDLFCESLDKFYSIIVECFPKVGTAENYDNKKKK
jgi:hypothetical protein